MLFTIKNKKYQSYDQLKTNTILNAYFIIKNYPLKATELAIDNYIKQQYKTSLKNMCIKLLLELTAYKDDDDNLVLLFKDPKFDAIARLITYGNGAIPGSKILKVAIHNF